MRRTVHVALTAVVLGLLLAGCPNTNTEPTTPNTNTTSTKEAPTWP